MLEEFLIKRFPSSGQQELRKYILDTWDAFQTCKLGDKNMEQELCSGDEGIYCQRMSELLFGKALMDAGLKPQARPSGPDFLLEVEGSRIWIEVICPGPQGIPKDYLDRTPGTVASVPHEQILLRWTSAINDKHQQLKRYLQKGTVSSSDVFVIAINGRRLSDFPSTGFVGISQLPYAVEAVFAIGPLAIQIDRETLKAIKTEHQHRPLIAKPSGAKVPATVFLDPAYSGISAIWAGVLNEGYDRGRSAVVHNPRAAVPLTIKLPAQEEFSAVEKDDQYLTLHRAPGLLTIP
jgi:hypothetical protein